MRKTTLSLKENNGISRVKGAVIMMFIFALITMPILSSADSSHSEKSVKDKYENIHGILEISAKDADFAINQVGSITAQQIIKKANPTAVHVGWGDPKSVQAQYSISSADVAKVNAIANTKGSATIAIKGAYVFKCTCGNVNVYGTANINVRATATEYNIVFDANGGKINGKSKQSVTVTCTAKDGAAVGSSTMPDDPAKKEYDFKGWSTSKKNYEKFGKNTKVDKNTTVYAHWTEKEVAPEPENKKIKNLDKKEPEPSETPTKTRFELLLSSNDIGGNGGNGSNLDGTATSGNSGNGYITKAEFMSLAGEQDVPVASIGQNAIPLFSPEGAGGSWAFVNLVMAAIGLVLAAVCTIIALKENRNKKSVWFMLTVVSGIAGAILFVLTENLKYNMVLTDKWTVLNAILLSAGITAIITFFRKGEPTEEFSYKYSDN